VAGFVQSPPNETLIRLAAGDWRPSARLVDIGCGAARNALPLAQAGWHVVGTDLSRPMLSAAARRLTDAGFAHRAHLLLAPMDRLPLAGQSVDFIVAHGIWNLARSGAEFRRAVREAARVARPGCPLFLFTFSRRTLSDDADPVADETFVFTQFSGEPQCFLTEPQLLEELAAGGFDVMASPPLRELNVRREGDPSVHAGPVIFEGLFRRGSR
jgi:ubiquinone/menaquinone biosynthesis C-methylase UbiE